MDTKIRNLHKDNWHAQSIVSEFVESYYDGDLKKMPVILSAIRNVEITMHLQF